MSERGSVGKSLKERKLPLGELLGGDIDIRLILWWELVVKNFDLVGFFIVYLERYLIDKETEGGVNSRYIDIDRQNGLGMDESTSTFG